MARQVSDTSIVKKPFKEFINVMSAKVQGTININEVTVNEPLDFFMLYSWQLLVYKNHLITLILQHFKMILYVGVMRKFSVKKDLVDHYLFVGDNGKLMVQ